MKRLIDNRFYFWTLFSFLLLSGTVIGFSTWDYEDIQEFLYEQPEFAPLMEELEENRDVLIPPIVAGRLTTESGVPVSSADRTAQSTLYFTPYKGNRIAIFDGVFWKLYRLTEISLALSGLTSGRNYDVFIYNNAGTLTLELSDPWTNDTTRDDALTTQDGVYVKSADLSRRYLGTFRSTSTTATEDSAAKRFLWNYYNRVQRKLKIVEATDSWTYNTDAWRAWNNSATNRVEFVLGQVEDPITAIFADLLRHASGNFITVGIGLDSTTVNSADIYPWTYGGVSVNHDECYFNKHVASGYHYLAPLERCLGGVGTCTWYGDDAGAIQGGMIGWING